MVEPRLKQVASVADRKILSESSSCDNQTCSSCDTIRYDCSTKISLGSILSNTLLLICQANLKIITLLGVREWFYVATATPKPWRVKNSLCQLSTDNRFDICYCVGRDIIEQAPKTLR